MARFTVPDMTCDGCVQAVTGAVRRLDAGAVVEVSLAEQQVAVQSRRAAADVAEAIRAAGFTVQDAA